MRSLARLWILSRGIRQRFDVTAPREELVRRLASRRTFVEIGCMWNGDGRIALWLSRVAPLQSRGLTSCPPPPTTGQSISTAPRGLVVSKAIYTMRM